MEKFSPLAKFYTPVWGAGRDKSHLWCRVSHQGQRHLAAHILFLLMRKRIADTNIENLSNSWHTCDLSYLFVGPQSEHIIFDSYNPLCWWFMSFSQSNTKHNAGKTYQIHICLYLAVEAKEGKESGELGDALVPPSPNPRHSEKHVRSRSKPLSILYFTG